MKEILRVEHLSKSFRLSAKQQRLEKTGEKIRHAVNDVSFSAYRGEIFGLLGPNGAGKTTTMRMLATLLRPDSGDAFLDGASIRTQETEVRSKLAFLTGELKLEDCFTPDYLFNFFSDLHGIDPAVREKRKQALFSRFGIDEFAQTKVANLSQGMKQKVSIVVSIVHDPNVIIFDEPTTGLHFHDINKLLESFNALIERGHTILIIEHNMDIIKCADHIIDMGPDGGDAGGNVVAKGTPEEISGCKESITGHYLREKLYGKGVE